MAWYDTGTVSVTNGSTTVTGSSTNFVSGAQIGEAFYGPDDNLYEIEAIVSATELTLADAYLGSTQSGQNYKIIPTQSLVADLAGQVTTLINDFQTVADEAGEGKFDDGSAASPGITFTQDQDTGFYRETANEIGISVGGSKIGEFNASGLTIDAADINGGTIDGVTLGTNSAVTEAQVDNINIDGNAITSTDTDGNIALTPNGSGEVDISKVDIDSGTIDGTVIGGSTPAAISGTTGTFSGDLTVDNNTLFVDASTDKVGIGTSSPNALLALEGSVSGGSDALLHVRNNATSASQPIWGVGVTRQNSATRALLLGSDNSDNAVFAVNGNLSSVFGKTVSGTFTEHMRIDTSGNVGIGTSSPSAKLEVSTGSDSNQGDISIVLGGTAANTRSAAIIKTADASGDLTFVAGRGTTGQSDFVFKVNDSTERMRITSSGDVGIGTSGPAAMLDVAEDAAFGAVASAAIDGATVSIRQPIAYDPADGDGTSAINIITQTTLADGSYMGGISWARMTSNGGTTAASISAIGETTVSTGLAFGTGSSNTEAMRIDSSGNVGIGTTSPSATLDVNGSLSKNSGSFKIDHPVKPDTHHLVHSFVEGPQADNLYRGKVTLVDGQATVNLDEAGRMTEGTFVALNGNVQCFTTNEDGWTQVRGSVAGNILTIEAQDPVCADEVSWLVIGERHDQHMIETEWTDENGRVITEPEKTLKGQ